MKKLIFIALILSIASTAKSQQKVKLFNAILTSKDINGTQNFNVKNFAETSKPIKDPLTADRLDYWVGKVFVDGNLRNLLVLFDLSKETAKYPYLDSIDMDYYASVSFRRYLKPLYNNESLYKELKSKFDNAKSNNEKKDLLLNDDYSKYFDALNKSKYLIDSSVVKNKDTIEKKLRLSIKLNLDSILLTKAISGKAGINASLENLLNKGVTISGTYYTVAYNADYLSKVYYYLVSKYKPNINQIGNIADKDQFLSTLWKYWKGKDDVGLITGSSVLKLQINYNVNKINIDTIKTIIKANVKIPEIEVAKLAVELYEGFSVNKTRSLSAVTSNYYCLSYAYFQELESNFEEDK